MSGPELFAVAKVVLGILTSLNSTRDTIQRIHDDTKSWQKFRSRCRFYLTEWNLWRGAIDRWIERYMVWEEDRDLFDHLWGSDWSTVMGCLEEIQNILGEARVQIESLSRPTEGAAKRLRYFQKQWSYLLYKQKPLEQALEKMYRHVPALENTSWDLFRHQHPEISEHQVPSDVVVHEVGNAFQLIRLARTTQALSQYLYQPCLDSQRNLCMFMELNFFGDDIVNPHSENVTTSRSEAISVSAKAEEMHFTFRASKMSNQLLRMRMTNKDIEPDHCHGSIFDAFNELSRPPAAVLNDVGYIDYQNGRRFLVRRVPMKTNGSLLPRSYRRFRTLLCEMLPFSPEIQQDSHMALSKIKAAFELVECGLLLHHTDWLSRFCSCSLHRRGSSDENYEYLLGQMGQDDDNPKHQCWCNYMPDADLRLRYLGLLLVEIALDGQAVLLRVLM